MSKKGTPAYNEDYFEEDLPNLTESAESDDFGSLEWLEARRPELFTSSVITAEQRKELQDEFPGLFKSRDFSKKQNDEIAVLREKVTEKELELLIKFAREIPKKQEELMKKADSLSQRNESLGLREKVLGIVTFKDDVKNLEEMVTKERKFFKRYSEIYRFVGKIGSELERRKQKRLNMINSPESEFASVVRGLKDYYSDLIEVYEKNLASLDKILKDLEVNLEKQNELLNKREEIVLRAQALRDEQMVESGEKSPEGIAATVAQKVKEI